MEAPDLDLYALAEARIEDLERLPACGQCKGCPGPEVAGSQCFSWVPGTPALKVRTWSFCPVGYTKVSTWRRIVERFIAAKISMLDGWTDEYTSVVYDAFVRLHVALRKEELRRHEERRSPARSSGSGTPFRARLTGGRK